VTSLRVLLARVAGLFQRSRRDRALDDEIQAHLGDLTDDLVAQGMSRAGAIAEARRRFGGIAQVKESYRDQRGWPSLDSLRHDVGLAGRLLRAQRGSTLLAVMSLGVGIGVSMGFFTVVNAICFRGLPIAQPDRVFALGTLDRESKAAGLSYPDFLDLRRETIALSGVAAYTTAAFSAADEREAAERVSGGYITPGAFRLLGVDPILGREFTSADDMPGAPAVVVIGHDVWTARYGGDRSVVGRSVRINGTPSTIIGVMPAGFRFPSQANAWLPLSAMPGLAAQPRSPRSLSAFGRIADDAAPADAHEDLAGLARRLDARHPETNRDIRFSAVPINEHVNGRVTDPVWLAFLTAGLLVLMVACANVANLQLARLAVRSREVALRLAMGATRVRLVRQLLIEGAVLAALSGVVGLAIAIGAVRLLAWSVPESAPLPYWITFTVDGRVLAALLVVCTTSVLFFSLVPAMHSARVRVNDLLKDGGRQGTASGRTRRWNAAFLIVQFALTVVLLANMSMDLRSDVAADAPGVAIDSTPLLTARVTLPPQRYGSPDRRRDFFDQLDERIRGAGGVTSMTVAGQLPPEGGGPMRLRLPDQTLGPGEEGERVFATSVGPRYLETLGIAPIAGRDLAADDGAPDRDAVVVSQHFADRVFPGRPALGERIALAADGHPEAPPVWRTIVGVVPDLHQGPLARALVYLPNRHNPPSSAVLLVRTTGSLESITGLLQQAVATLDPDLPVSRPVPLELAWHESSWMGRASSGILKTASTIALLLAVVGLYAATAHAVAQRTHEIGIRVALGATPRTVTILVLRRALALVGLGLATGLPATYVFARLFTDATATPSLTSPANLLPVAGVVVVISIVACAWPAVTAARIQPSRTLNAD
jgi:putative ABC transport system permease protein